MTWKETSVMEQKKELICDWLKREYNITELSGIYEVSRPTIYKWVDRYKKDGESGLEERSRAALSHPNATPPDLIARIVNMKLERQKWGPKKIIVRLQCLSPEEEWPAASTAGEILKKHGLVMARKRKRRAPPYTKPFKECDEPNKVWSADYKGYFKMGSGRKCYPLTISDNNTRFLLQCRGLMHPKFAETRRWFEWTFREYGLPEAIRTDNGLPFATAGLGGLSRLSVWWIRLGITPERIEPGRPEQNSRHERMHRTLKDFCANPPKQNLRKQQRSFDDFINEYNYERPHEALGQRTPGSIYQPSPRVYPAKPPKIEYGTNVEVRKVMKGGRAKWKGQDIYVSHSLTEETIAFKRIDEELLTVYYSFYPIGILNERTGNIEQMTVKVASGAI